MKSLWPLLETYIMVLVHPFRVHQQFRHHLPLPGHDGYIYRPLTLAESLGISWVFAVIRGLFKIILINFFLQAFISMQSDTFPILQEIIETSSLSTYYFLLFSAALDIIFFPITAMIMTEIWAWVIRRYTQWLNPELPKDEIADQITTHALSSNLFAIIPILGDLVQGILYYFLLYAGLRSNLGASRSLAWVILLTPTLIAFMIMSSLLVTVIYLIA